MIDIFQKEGEGAFVDEKVSGVGRERVRVTSWLTRVSEEGLDEMFLRFLQHLNDSLVNRILILVQPTSNVVAHLQKARN